MENFAFQEKPSHDSQQRKKVESIPEISVQSMVKIFREAKQKDLDRQAGQDDSTSWAERYVSYVVKRLKESHQGNIPEFLESEEFPHFLESTEYTHNADWPEYFALVIYDHLNGISHDSTFYSEWMDSSDALELRDNLDEFYLNISQDQIDEKHQDIINIAELLKEAKSAHLKYQAEQGTNVPWDEWYAKYLSDKFSNLFGDRGVSFDESTLKKLLVEGEEMHTSEWPRVFATTVKKKLDGVDMLTPKEKQEFLFLKNMAKKAGRIEKIPDGTMRRRYLALHTKQMHGPLEEGGDFESESPEQEAENLTAAEVESREKSMEAIRQGVDNWVEQQGIEERHLSKEQLANLVRYLHDTPEYKKEIYAIADNFIDREKYIQRPAVLIYEAGRDRMDVDLYLLGWRSPQDGWEDTAVEEEGVPEYLAGSDGTYIHDHEATEAGVQVLDYDPLTERLFVTDHAKTADAPFAEREYFDPGLPEEERIYDYTEIERQFQPGSNLQVGAPYIHQFKGPEEAGEHGMAVTLHAYSTDPEAVPEDLSPGVNKMKKRKGGLYKMNYFLKVSDKETGKKGLEHVGWYTMYESDSEESETRTEGVVEGVTSLKDIPKPAGKWMFC